MILMRLQWAVWVAFRVAGLHPEYSRTNATDSEEEADALKLVRPRLEELCIEAELNERRNHIPYLLTALFQFQAGNFFEAVQLAIYALEVDGGLNRGLGEKTSIADLILASVEALDKARKSFRN